MNLTYDKFKSYFSKVYKYNSFSKQLRLCLVFSFALLLIDNKNLLSKLISFEGRDIFIVGVIFCFMYIFLFVIEQGIKDAYYMKSTNVLDICVMDLILVTVVYGGAIIFIKEAYSYKLWSIFLMDLFLVYIILRRVNITTEIENKTQGNIITLKQLFEGDFVRESQEPILLKDEEANYDLLGRSQIINYIYQAVKMIKNDKRFVISLEGKWVSGKSTILNGVKEKLKEYNDAVILDTFDPSIYNDKTVMLESMFGYLMKQSGIKFNTLDLRKKIKDFPKLFFKSEGISNFFLKSETIEDIRSQINDFLKASGKKYVFVIDNIDRVDNENILSVFKFVSGILNFNNVIYILSFDDEKVKKAFETDSEVDYSYLKKIINLPIRVPEIQTERLQNIFYKSLENICKGYGLEKLIYELGGYIDFICKMNFDLRDFTRLINGPINYVLNENCFLNRKDLLVLETIKEYNFELYRRVYLNKTLFISKNLPPDIAMRQGFEVEKIKSKRVSLYKDLNEKYGEYFRVLAEVFPYVKEYFGNNNAKSMGNPEEKTTRSIDSWKYFDLYFCHTINHYIDIENDVDEFIDQINKNCLVELENLNKLIKLMESKEWLYQKEFLERLLYSLDKINSSGYVPLVNFILNNNMKFSFNRFLFFLSPHQRLAMIMSELINRITEEELDCILRLAEEDYKNLGFWQVVIRNFDQSVYNPLEERKNKLELLLKEKIEEIIERNIDIYRDENYSYRNLVVLAEYCSTDDERLVRYVNNILNKNNIYRFLYDVIDISYNFNKDFDIDFSRIKYRFEAGNLERYTTLDNVQKLLDEKSPVNEAEFMLAEAFRNFIESDGELMEGLVRNKFYFNEL